MSDAFLSITPAAPAAPARSSKAAPPSAAAPRSASKGDLKQTILTAILAERTRKAAKRAAGLPESDDSDSSDDDDSTTRSQRKAAAHKTAASSTAADGGSSPASSSSAATEYGTASYWDARYSKTTGTFDWYVDHEHLLPLMTEWGRAARHDKQRRHTQVNSSDAAATAHIAAHSTAATPASSSSHSFDPASVRLLDVGCGNSGLAESLYKAGWTDQTHIDISGVIVDRMRAHYKSAPSNYGRWLTMDATAMRFADCSFDLILEKGTIDALDCSPDSDRIISGILAECARVLTPGGVAIIVTHGGPRFRLPTMTRPELGWTVHTRPLAYSSSALFIRRLRAQLQGLPLSQAPPEMIAQCAVEVKEIKTHMREDLARAAACIARVEAEAAAAAQGVERPDRSDDEEAALLREESAAFSPATSNICFAYCCVKHADKGAKPVTDTTAAGASATEPPPKDA